MPIDQIFSLLADWCVDLSAASFAAAFLVTTQKPFNIKVVLADVIYSLAFFLLAFILTTI